MVISAVALESFAVRAPVPVGIPELLPMGEGSLAKVFGRYDNDWGYSCRRLDLGTRVGTAQ